MKHLNACLSLFSLCMVSGMVYADCTTDPVPEGPAAVITCAASLRGMTAENFWNNVLFSPVTLDSYCKSYPSYPSATVTTAQKNMYDAACSSYQAPGANNYFSYDKFIAADAAIAAAAATDGFSYTFMRNGSYALNVTELSNFLATASQETTGNGLLPEKYEQDGLYYRYENSYLGSDCYTYPANPNWISGATVTQPSPSACSALSLANFYTNYYPVSSYAVAVESGDHSMVYTPYMAYLDSRYSATSPMSVSFPGYPTLYAGGTVSPPTGATWEYLNTTLDQGNWVGLGNLQLTNVSMPQFFDWYEQNIVTPGTPVNYANFQTFVNSYLTSGLLAWEGGLWYWNFRVNGYNLPTVHAVLTGTKPACHDIGLTTFLVNGGCNDDTTRVSYYKYYKTKVFKFSSEGVPFSYQGYDGNSMECASQLGSYCQAQ